MNPKIHSQPLLFSLIFLQVKTILESFFSETVLKNHYQKHPHPKRPTSTGPVAEPPVLGGTGIGALDREEELEVEEGFPSKGRLSVDCIDVPTP